MAADVVGYSQLMQADEAGTHARLKARYEALVAPKIEEHGGRVVKLMGDGLLAEFPSVVGAAEWAVEFQSEVAAMNASEPPEHRMEYRVGVDLGDVIVDGDDIYGDGVNVAARLQEVAEPCGVCLSDAAFQQLRGKVEVAFIDGGVVSLKNITAPVRVWRWSSTTSGGADVRGSMEGCDLILRDRPSIAVLPFNNMSGDPEQDYFADGIAEDIITALSRIQWFFVTARNSTFTYKGRAVDVQQVGRELGVRYILEGSVRKSGQRLRVTAQLIDATTGKHVWAERYDREVSDTFEVQDEITRNVVATTQTQVLLVEGSLFERLEKPSLPVWALVNRSWILMYEMTADSLSKAQRLAEEAIALDPRSGRAHQALAVHLWHRAWMGFAKDAKATLTRGREMAERAVRLNDFDEYSHWILGLSQMANGEYDNAIAELERAIEINPNCSLAYGSLATVLNHAGRPEEAIGKNEIAIRSNPRDPSIFSRYHGLALSHFLLQQHDTAIAWARKTVQHNPRWFQGHAVLVASLVELGHVDAASAALADYLKQFPSASLADIENLPFRVRTHRQRLVDALRRAGLPE